MKRNMNKVRELLIKIEETGVDDTYYTDDQEECYHLRIMKDGGLVEGWVADDGVDGMTAEITRMTWKGHEFLDAIRDDGVWEKVNQKRSENEPQETCFGPLPYGGLHLHGMRRFRKRTRDRWRRTACAL